MSLRITRTAVSASAAVVLTAGTLALTAPTASAADGCYRSGSTYTCDWSWGDMAASFTGSGASSHISGWVRDLKADGYCTQFEVTWTLTNGTKDTDYSPQACPKGDRDSFDMMPGDGTHRAWTSRAYSFNRV